MLQRAEIMRLGSAAPGVGAAPIVVDMGEGAVRAVQARKRGEPRVCCYPALHDAIGQADESAACLAGVLDRHGFVGSRVVLIAPRRLTRASLVAVPRAAEGVPIDAIVRAEVARVHGIDDGFEVVKWPLPRSSDATGEAGVMVQAIEHKPALGVVRALERQGLVVESLLPVTPLLTRSAVAMGITGSGMSVLIEAGWRDAYVSALIAGVCVYQRTLSGVGLGAVLAQALDDGADAADAIESEGGRLAGVTDGGLVSRSAAAVADQLGSEAKRVSEYASRRYRGHQLGAALLSGDLWDVPGAEARVAASVGAAARVLRPGALLGAEAPYAPGFGAAIAAAAFATGVAA
ncbi:MAG: hypothetical protein AAF995_03890 [Planctomycetota bacterium]